MLTNTKLQLNKVLKIKESLEESIKRDDTNIQKYNSIIVGNKRPIDIRKTIENLTLKEKQLVILKLAITTANLQKHEGEELTNYDYVFMLSNRKRLKAVYTSPKMKTTDGCSESHTGPINYEAIILQNELNDELKKIDQEISEIEIKLANFNHKTEIEVNLYNELNLV